MDKLKYIKLENEDGSYSNSIPLAVDSDYVDVSGNTLTNKLETLATKTEVQAVASGSPAGVYATVAALTTADPDHSKIYVVTADGHWYYYNNGWQDGGVYQAAEDSNILTDAVRDINTIGEEVNIGYQLWDVSKATTGQLQSNGTIRTDGSYSDYCTSDFFEVIGNETYYIRTFDDQGELKSSTKGYLCYNSSKEIIANSYVSITGVSLSFQIAAGTKYIRIFAKTIFHPLFYRGNFTLLDPQEYTTAFINKMMFNENWIKSIEVRGKNLIDLNKITVNKFLGITNRFSDLAYNTTDYIPIQANESITFTPNIRCYGFYNIYKAPLEYQNFSSQQYTFTAPEDGYIRVSYTNDITTPQAEIGSSATPYEPYNTKKYFENNIHLSETMEDDVRNVIVSDSNGKLLLKKNNNNIEIDSFFGDDVLKRNYLIKNESNYNFNFYNTYLNNIMIKSCQDDITPLRLGVNDSQWTIGANHGWPCFSIGKGNLTDDDIGSVWTDGVTDYVLASVRDSKAYFLYPCSEGANVTNISYTDPTSDLVHKSGATHTTSLSISSITTATNLYPSVNNNQISIYCDERLVTNDTEYYCNKVIVKEHYDIMNYVDISNYLQNHIGHSLNEVKNNIDTVAAIDLIYEIDEQNEIVYTSVIANKNIILKDCGFMQSMVLQGTTGGTVYRHLNGISGGTFDSQNVVDLTNYSTSTNIYKSSLVDANIPVNRSTDLCLDNSNNNIKYGFTFGFIPDMSYGKNSLRKDVTYQWNLRDTKKSYPYCIYNMNLDRNKAVDVIGYRHYILPNQKNINETVISLGNVKYVFFDGITQQDGNIICNDIGHKVTNLNSAGINYADCVCSKGLNYSMTANYAYGELKID